MPNHHLMKQTWKKKKANPDQVGDFENEELEIDS